MKFIFKKQLRIILLFVALAISGCGDKSDSATAKCSDGSTSSSKNCSGTCSGHGGVSVWYVSGCGSNKIVPNPVVTPVVFYNTHISGVWSGTFNWHRNSVITRGSIIVNFIDGKIVSGDFYIGSNGERYHISGGIDSDNGVTMYIANSENTLLFGDIEIDINNHIVGNINTVKQSQSNMADGIFQFDLAKQ